MESPFNEKDERTESTVFSSPISVQQQAPQQSTTENRELVNSGISVSIVQDPHNMIVMNQDSRVALPSLVTNNHDQATNQEGLGNEMGEEMNMYPPLEGNVILYPGQRIDNERASHIQVTGEMKTDMDIIDEGKKRLDNTLVGKIVEVLRIPVFDLLEIGREGRPLRREEIQSKIGDGFNQLRKSDGTKYKGDRLKALNGALYSTGIFHKENDLWSVRPAELESYERKTRLKLETRGRRKRQNDGSNDGDEPYVKRKYVRKQIKRSAVVKLLKDTTERLRMNNRETNEIYFKNPFQGLAGTEEIIKIRKKLGDEKFEMAIQMYNYFEDVLSRVMAEGDNPSVTYTDEHTSHIIDQLQMEVANLKNQIQVLENKINVE